MFLADSGVTLATSESGKAKLDLLIIPDILLVKLLRTLVFVAGVDDGSNENRRILSTSDSNSSLDAAEILIFL